jgi:hypothetical protein
MLIDFSGFFMESLTLVSMRIVLFLIVVDKLIFDALFDAQMGALEFV